MELRNILSFLKIVEMGNFSRAAEDLGYAQSTITFQIKQLEDELGTPLFERIGHTVTLSSYGQEYLPLARQIEITTLEMHNLGKNYAEIRGTLRIGIVESLLFSKLLTLLPKYNKIFPNITIDLSSASSSELSNSLQKNQLDIICCLGTTTPITEFKQVFSKEMPLAFITNATSKLCNEKSLSLEKISKENFILTESSSIYHQSLLRLFERNKLTLKQSARVKSTWAIVNLLEYTEGISYLPIYVAQSKIDSGTLRILHTDTPLPNINIVVEIHQKKWISPQLKEFINLIKTEPWLS